MTTASRVGLLICQDLMFISKVTGTANSLGFKVQAMGPKPGLVQAAEGGLACVILDLSVQPFAVVDLMQALGDNPPPVIAFGAHVETARLAEAREAGCREVLPRSQFNMQIGEILTRYLSDA